MKKILAFIFIANLACESLSNEITFKHRNKILKLVLHGNTFFLGIPRNGITEYKSTGMIRGCYFSITQKKYQTIISYKNSYDESFRKIIIRKKRKK